MKAFDQDRMERHLIQPTKSHERALTVDLWPDHEAPRRWFAIEGVPFPGNFAVLDRLRLSGPDIDPQDLFGAIERARSGQSGLTLHVWYTFSTWDTAVRCVGVEFLLDEESAIGRSGTTTDVTSATFGHAKIDDVRRRVIEYFTQLHALASDVPAQRRVARSIERRNTGVKPDVIREAASIYNQNIAGTPLKAVRERLGISKSTAEKYIRLARDAGYVTESAKPGRRQKP